MAYTNPEAELIELGRPQSLTSHLDTHAEVLLAELAEESLTERVKRAVYAGMANRHVSIRAVARTLGMSSRTLQRRLRHEQLTYRIVVSRVRREAIQHYIEKEGLRLPQVAEKVGFSDVSSLRRAMKKWPRTGH